MQKLLRSERESVGRMVEDSEAVIKLSLEFEVSRRLQAARVRPAEPVAIEP